MYRTRRELEELLEKAERCAQGPWYKRLSRSIRDEDTLKMIRTDLASTIQRFQVRVSSVVWTCAHGHPPGSLLVVCLSRP